MYKYMPVVLLSLAVAVRLPSSVPHQAERSCPAGGRPSDTQLSAGWQPPPTSQLDKRWSFQSFQTVKYISQNSTKGELSDGFLKKFCSFVSSDKKPLEIDARMNMIACPDGRQLLMIMHTTKKDAGVYECVATNPLASMSSSCTISLARKEKENTQLSKCLSL